MYRESDTRVEEILNGLSLKEKIGQLNQIRMPSLDKEELKRRIKNGEIGGFYLADSLTPGNHRQQAVFTELLDELQRCAVEESKSGIPLIWGRDVIHGYHTIFPIPLASVCSFNPELWKECYRCMAKEMVADGIHWNYAPMLDVCHEPRWGRIIEGPGEDPYVASKMAEAAVKGFQGDNLTDEDSVVACAKHYLGYGATEGGRDYFRTEISDYTLYNQILPPFRAAVKAGVGTVMSSFNDINGQPVTSSRKYLTDILRGELGFDGFVVSDANAVAELQKQGVAENDAEAAKLSIHAGVDMDMASQCYINELEKLVVSGQISEELIDEAVRRVLRIKLAKGLFEKPYCEERSVNQEEILEMAEQMAAESMVLLKNKGEVLPLKKETRTVLAGPFVYENSSLHGSWASDGELEITPTLAEVNGSFVAVSPELTPAEVVILALGEARETTGEAHAVADISLSKDQVELARKVHESGKKAVGVIFCGRPVALGNIEPYLDAILIAWHGGTMCAEAVNKILYGEYVPSGKTVTTFVRTTGHIPMYYNTTHPCKAVNGYYGENPKGNYVDIPGSPMYPFGYGLSYTTFKYSDIEIQQDVISLERLMNGDTFELSIKVRNTGNYSGKEVVQLYVHDKVASLMRPQRELKGFQKIELTVGEEKDVTFSIGADSLGFYNNEGQYIVEKGQFDLYVGEHCLTDNKVEVRVI